MSSKAKNIVIAVLCLVIAGALGLSVYNIVNAQPTASAPNPNAVIVAAPDQDGFEEHPDWVIEEPEVSDYGENLALGKEVKQNGQTQVYNCKNAVDGNRYTYWEGKPDAYPSEITVNLGAVMELGGAQVMLSPNQIWGARTQDVEISVSDDGEAFTVAAAQTTLSFDPLENGNAAYMPFEAGTRGQYVRFSFYSNSGATAGQAAEVEIYGPQG